MPELPEVEVVRQGLHRWVRQRRITGAVVLHPRAIRRHAAGPDDFLEQVTGATIRDVRRRGKFLWLPLDTGACLLAHLGMSGQLLVSALPQPPQQRAHLRVSFELGAASQEANPEASRLHFVDQRTFGGLWVAATVGDALPACLEHIAPDPLDPTFDDAVFSTKLRTRRTHIKRALLDQTLISGVGNIYADEALWRARVHYARPTQQITNFEICALLVGLREVFTAALAAGGTSFDSLYVNVNGRSGYFNRSLHAYGQHGRPCPRCGTAIVREAFMNRSSFYCPSCQPQA